MRRKFQFELNTPDETLDDIIYCMYEGKDIGHYSNVLIYTLLRELHIIDHPNAKERYNHWLKVLKLLNDEMQ